MRTIKVLFPGATCCAFLLCAISTVAFAQFRGAIQGTVKDTSGGLIPGATVTLTNNETQRKQTATSSGEGFYHFAGLAPGTYTIEASAKGMRNAVMKDLVLGAESTTGADITLEAGAVSETVTVNAGEIP